ncbi:hypothetical protein PanWU01x14_111410 [Parasponia andersonii]|uniref:Uncharacterized protein n=1 Tax=Parasponia andersonii TaxID=3476 RepID=A0A2P5CZ18_PARAD|nr:hypothetical protein PanWU01x14_111410 [Parasponia andersonii]
MLRLVLSGIRGLVRNPGFVLEDASSWWNEYRTVTYVLEIKHPDSATKADFKWKPPNEGCLKLNVDALVSTGASFVGVGVEGWLLEVLSVLPLLSD